MIKQFFPPVLLKVFQLFRRRNYYKVGEFKIKIPFNHKLPSYQAKYKMYDRFLPILASKINSDGIIIDVGANVGDTAISMLQQSKKTIYCFEPSDFFYSYLDSNINRLPSEFKKRIQCFKNLIGTSTFKGALTHSGGGTATIVHDENSTNNHFKSLDTLIQEQQRVSLIKVDTDGFDFDVLMSGKNILSDSEPILFWENVMEKDFQVEGYNQLYTTLEKIGYCHLYVFDNFGNIMLEETDFPTLKCINRYISNMSHKNALKSIYYTDVLAVTAKNHKAALDAIKTYRTSFLLD